MRREAPEPLVGGGDEAVVHRLDGLEGAEAEAAVAVPRVALAHAHLAKLGLLSSLENGDMNQSEAASDLGVLGGPATRPTAA